MTGFRMIPAGIGLMMPADRALERDRVRVRLRHVGGDDGRHDDALGGADDPHLCPRRPAGGERAASRSPRPAGSRPAICWPGSLLRSPQRSRNGRWSARACSTPDDGRRQQRARRPRADRRRALSMDAAQGRLSAAMPVAAPVHPAARRLPRRCAGLAALGAAARRSIASAAAGC